MKVIKVKLKERSYNVIIGNTILKFLGKYLKQLNIGEDAYIITNPLIKNIYGKFLAQILKKAGFRFKFQVVADTEKSKSINTAFRLLNHLNFYAQQRRIFIIAFGGGVIGDLAGFVAGIYKRGIPYIQIPTTLLAQVDSSIGGKTALDLTSGKNLIGTFYQPKLVLSDLILLKTLNLRQIRSGLAEVIKYGIIKDRKLFNFIENNYTQIIQQKKEPLEYIVRKCTQIKAKIIEQDEKETKGIRTILNFGHTLGHALEAAGNYKKYNHGEAVSIGMLLAIDLSKRILKLENSTAQRIENLIKKIDLPSQIKNISVNNILKAYYQDKKFMGKKNKFVLIKDIGRTKIIEDIPLKIIREVIKKRILAVRKKRKG